MKDVLPDATGVGYEDTDLMKFELFLNGATKRNDLSFISRGTSTSDGKLLASNGAPHILSNSRVTNSSKTSPLMYLSLMILDRLLYHLGFDWLSIMRVRPSNEDDALMHINYENVGTPAC